MARCYKQRYLFQTTQTPSCWIIRGSYNQTGGLIEFNNTNVGRFPGKPAYSGKEGSIQGRPPQS